MLRKSKRPHTILYYVEKDRLVSTFRESDGVTTTADSDIVTEILGRPIRLSDVLAAMPLGQHFHLKTLGNQLRMFSDGNLEWWNLLNDDLSLQSEACINFLHGLLVTEKI